MMRRSRLKRTTPLVAKTRLVAKTWMKRGKSTLDQQRPTDTGPSKKIRDKVKERADHICERCSQHRGEVIHHRDPRGAGGTSRPEANLPSNLVFICSSCHLDVEVTDRLVAIGDGWLVLDNYDPREVRIRMWHRGVFGEWFLLDNGDVEPAPGKHPTGCALWRSNNPLDCDCGSVEPHQKEAS